MLMLFGMAWQLKDCEAPSTLPDAVTVLGRVGIADLKRLDGSLKSEVILEYFDEEDTFLEGRLCWSYAPFKLRCTLGCRVWSSRCFS